VRRAAGGPRHACACTPPTTGRPWPRRPGRAGGPSSPPSTGAPGCPIPTTRPPSSGPSSTGSGPAGGTRGGGGGGVGGGDPNDPPPFERSKLDWERAGGETLELWRTLLRLRREVPALGNCRRDLTTARVDPRRGLGVPEGGGPSGA